MSKHKVISQRGPTVTLRLREEAHKKYQELTEYRFNMNLNSNKGDIMSQAIEELYEKELGRFKGEAIKADGETGKFKPKEGVVNVNK